MATETGGPDGLDPVRLKFEIGHVSPIISRAKWVTARYGLAEPVSPGQDLVMLTTEGRAFAKAPIEMCAEVTIAGFYGYDVDGHESYRTLGDCLAAFQGYYPEAGLSTDSLIDVIWWDPQQVNVHPDFLERGGVDADKHREWTDIGGGSRV